MFNVKRNGASVEITDIPQSIPFSVFKDIADETGANECLVAYVKDKDSYEVVIRYDSVNMAGAAAWLVLEAREPEAEDVDISAIGASEGSVFRWETGKTIPSNKYINCLAAVLECDPQWLLNGNSNYKNKLPSDCESRNMEESVMIATREVSRSMEKHKINSLFKPYYVLVFN
ncbi:hypothetical protein AAQ05_004726 [Salmonella enterica subsp. diarizonae]|nr:hypothetical protein [Salmonella enterica subsp. diarizonae]